MSKTMERFKVRGVLWRSALMAVMLVAAAMPLRAQVLYGAIVGTVADSSGGALPGATVTITNIQTNQSRNAVTNSQGQYNFPNVAAGTYTVDVTMPGLQPFKAEQIAVAANSSVRVDATLNVGGVEETVTVSADAARLQTETAAVQTQIAAQTLESVPVNGRSFQSLLVLTPGVAQPNYFQTGGINNPSRAMQVSVNGAPNQNTVFRLDGVSATNQWIEGLQSYTPAMEAIESVNVVTSSFDAEQGMAGSASVNVQIKSGTNTLRGAAFHYQTTAALRARNYFLPDDQDKTKDNKGIFGGTIGGPIRRDKLFYFVSSETTMARAIGGPYVTQATGNNSQFLSVPSDEIRAGRFGNNAVVFDPLTGGVNGVNRQPFAFANCPQFAGLPASTAAQQLALLDTPGFAACNFIPESRFNSTTKNLLAFLPRAQYPGNANNYFAIPEYNSDYTKVDTKLTWNAGNNLSVNGRFSYLPSKEHAKGLYDGDPTIQRQQEFNPLAVGTLLDSIVTSGALSATKILTSNFVVDGLIGWTRQHTYQIPPGPENCWGEVVGIPNSCQARDYALPRIDISGWSSYGNGIRTNDNTASVFDYLDPQYQYAFNASWTRGGHNIKFGADLHRLHMNHYEITSPAIGFNGSATSLNAPGAPGTNLYTAYADFLLGMVRNRQVATQTPLLNEDNGSNDLSATMRSWEYGLYIRDQFQVGRRVTVSAGLRWEYYPVPQRADRGIEAFDFNTLLLRICGVGPNPIDCGIKVQKDLFTPRLGIAYRASDSLVFRAGYSRNPQNNNMGRAQLRNFPVNIQVAETGAGNFDSVGLLSDGYPILPTADISSGIVKLPQGSGITSIDTENTYIRGVISSFNVSMQKALPFEITANIAYVGNRQNNMIRNQNLNVSQVLGGGNASLPYNQPGLPNGFRTTSGVSKTMGNGRVTYDSLQVSVTRRMTDGLSLNAAYTYAKGTDAWGGGIGIDSLAEFRKVPTNEVPNRFNMSAVWEVPVGEGRRFLNRGGALAAIAGGWQLNVLFSAAQGSTFGMGASGTSLNTPGTTQRADQVKDVTYPKGTNPTTPWYDVTAFRPVTEMRLGNSKTNAIRGPGMQNLDLSFFKNMSLGAGTLQLRIETFNFLNRANFANPGGNNISNVTFNADGTVRALNGVGVISGTNNVGREYAERYARVGVRFSF